MMGGAEGVLTEGPSSQNCPGSPFYSLLGEKMGFFFFFFKSGNSQSFKNIDLGETDQKFLFEHQLRVFPWFTEELKRVITLPILTPSSEQTHRQEGACESFREERRHCSSRNTSNATFMLQKKFRGPR